MFGALSCARSGYSAIKSRRPSISSFVNVGWESYNERHEKLDNVTWYGHCVIHVMAAINDLPQDAKLVFCQDLEKFIKHQERVLSET